MRGYITTSHSRRVPFPIIFFTFSRKAVAPLGTAPMYRLSVMIKWRYRWDRFTQTWVLQARQMWLFGLEGDDRPPSQLLPGFAPENYRKKFLV